MENLEFDISDIIKLQQKINIKRTYLEDEVSYASYIKDIAEDYIMIEFPTSGRTAVPLKPESEVELTVITPEAIWVGPSFVAETVKGLSGGVWISIPEYFEKIQRRDFLRIKEEFFVKLSYIKSEGKTEDLELKCANISAGGISVYSKKPLEKNLPMVVEFEYEGFRVSSRVKYIHTQYEIVEKMYLSGLKFLEVDLKTVNMLHKIICKRQIEYRKKGLL